MSYTQARLSLKSINLNNFATFNDQTINFKTKFNSIIGETGSGKSLILDALQIILGARADRKLVRKESEYATIEGVFDCKDKDVREFFNEIGYPFENEEIIIKRIIFANGKSKSYLNFQLCNLHVLQRFSKRFIDIVGQFENQKLLTSSYQLVLLDNYAHNKILLNEYQSYYKSLISVRSDIDQALESHATRSQRLDYINYQINELSKLNPDIDTEQRLIEKKDQISNIEQTKQLLENVEYLFDSENGITNNISRLEKELNQNITFISNHLLEKFYTAKDLLNEINYEISCKTHADFNEQELNDIVEHLDLYQKLKRKFGTDTEGLERIYKEFIEEKELLETHDIHITDLKDKENKLYNKCIDIAEQLHLSRIKYAKKLSGSLSHLVQDLNMKGATIDIKIQRAKELNHYGLSEVEFLAETNPGEGFHKVKEIASGGELSRILLALRQVLCSKDSISIFFFDEIDSGVGGETALKIGNALKEVSMNSQVITITHLPQIANYSDRLIVVSKNILRHEGRQRTQSTVVEVNEDNIKSHVDRMTPLN